MDAADSAAVILAGGRARRLGGQDKTRLRIGGASPLLRVLRACPTELRVVVGHPPAQQDRAEYDGVAWVREDPPLSGPLAALARGLEELPRLRGRASLTRTEGEDHDGDQRADIAGRVLVLGGDMPHLSRRTLERLLAAGTEGEPGLVHSVQDADGHLQYLCAAWPLSRLRTAVAVLAAEHDGLDGVPLRRLYETVPDHELRVLDADPTELEDIDTPEDLTRARERLEGEPGERRHAPTHEIHDEDER
ncbi:MAG: molybdenum cofactor guanylyltransferase [Brachybacterium sp.]|nr:molybdenum cofactor guanylyltransferase [Brachybacterium sp.]